MGPERLSRAEARVERAQRATGVAGSRSESATPGGLVGYDSAVLSGIRRKPNHKADVRRFAAYDREAAAWAELNAAEKELAHVRSTIEQQAREAAEKSVVTPEAIAAARFIRTRSGWHKVVRVSPKSITVETPWSWTERIARDKVLEVRT